MPPDGRNHRTRDAPEPADGLPSTPASSVTSITSIPSGSAASSRWHTCVSSCRTVSARLRYSASLATHGRRTARIGNLRMRREPGRVSDRQTCPAHSPLESARHVPVAGETHLSTLSIPDHQMLHRRPGGCRFRHATSRPLREAAASRQGALPSDPPGSRYPWRDKPRIHNTESSGNLPPQPPRTLGSDGILPVLPQPVAVKTRVQVIPGEHLAVITFARSIPCKIHRLPGQGRLGTPLPALEREVLAPSVEPPAVPPRRQDHAAHPAVAAG